MEDRRVSATNNVAEREIRPSVVFCKVTGGFRSEWDPSVHAGHRSVTSTARIYPLRTRCSDSMKPATTIPLTCRSAACRMRDSRRRRLKHGR
ncbi:MAG TPA: hypothetical protein ENH55_13500 [Aurantimonas coralicida]|uniref:Transposase IS66 central domain-containing protein n=1 Tax=Aurantimonas coralicida TaxID=182270 RepID=A0A9C9NI75_9HYPH|nr:hypothetical protein [Aurantimonas coralicida]HEU02242.1 hypothetical protein [Aurantimonas coralicida]